MPSALRCRRDVSPPAPCESPIQSEEGVAEEGGGRERKRGKHKPPGNKGQLPRHSAGAETKEMVVGAEQHPDRGKHLTSSGGLGVFEGDGSGVKI